MALTIHSSPLHFSPLWDINGFFPYNLQIVTLNQFRMTKSMLTIFIS